MSTTYHDRLRAVLADVARLADRYSSSAYLQRLAKQATSVLAEVEAAREAPTRLFGRIHAADLECPRCHAVLSFGPKHLTTTRARRRSAGWAWDPLFGRLTCPRCTAVYLPALCLYRPSAAGLVAAPADHVPTTRERLELRGGSEGWLMPDRLRKHPTTTNLVQPENCTCPPGPTRAGLDPLCPVHGPT